MSEKYDFDKAVESIAQALISIEGMIEDEDVMENMACGGKLCIEFEELLKEYIWENEDFNSIEAEIMANDFKDVLSERIEGYNELTSSYTEDMRKAAFACFLIKQMESTMRAFNNSIRMAESNIAAETNEMIDSIILGNIH